LALDRLGRFGGDFWLKADISLAWAVIASACLRTCSLCSATNSDSDLALITDLRKSKLASALARRASMALVLNSTKPFAAVEQLASRAPVASSAAAFALA